MNKKLVKLINENIIKYVPLNTIPNLHDGIKYALEIDEKSLGKAKRVRPLLCLETCKSLGGDVNKAIPFSIACELFHGWTLVHDDWQDGDIRRRGRDAVWTVFGANHAINIGDSMAHLVFRAVLNLKKVGVCKEKISELIELIAETAIITAEGQAMEMNLTNNSKVTQKEYMDMIMRKTGHCIVLPIIGGIILSTNDKKLIETTKEFGKYFGAIFQIRDDIIDLTEGKGREEIGCDIKEGKRSFLVAYCNENMNEKDRVHMFSILDKDRNSTTTKNIKEIINLFDEYGAKDYAEGKVDELYENAIELISDFPEEFKELLLNTIEDLKNRRT